MFWIVFLIVLCCLFVLADAWYLFSVIIKGVMYFSSPPLKPRTPEEFLEPILVNRRVMPRDVGVLMHMNNARYTKAVEFESLRTGLYAANKNLRATITATTVRFMRELRLFQSYRIRTSIVYWTNSDMYLEHRFETGPYSFVNCIVYIRLSFKNVTVTEAIKKVCGGKEVQCPDPPQDLLKWIEYVNSSSEQLRGEAKKAR